MAKIPLSNAIDSEVYNILNNLCDELGPPKNKIIESAIEVFSRLDIDIQQTLKSNRQADRNLILDLIGALKVPSQSGKDGHRKKTAG